MVGRLNFSSTWSEIFSPFLVITAKDLKTSLSSKCMCVRMCVCACVRACVWERYVGGRGGGCMCKYAHYCMFGKYALMDPLTVYYSILNSLSACGHKHNSKWIIMLHSIFCICHLSLQMLSKVNCATLRKALMYVHECMHVWIKSDHIGHNTNSSAKKILH